MRVSKSGVITQDYIVYTGGRQKGTITIAIMGASSPFRYFHYQEGGRYEVGVEVNEKVAAWLIKYHKTTFAIVEEVIEGDDAFVVAFANLLALYKPILKLDELEDFLPLLERGFKHEGSVVKIRRVIPRKKTKEEGKKEAAKLALKKNGGNK